MNIFNDISYQEFHNYDDRIITYKNGNLKSEGAVYNDTTLSKRYKRTLRNFSRTGLKSYHENSNLNSVRHF